MKHTECYVHEYPRPQFVRDGWINLNGTWDFAFDAENLGESRGYRDGFQRQHEITVPYSYESKASGIGITDMVEHVWYSRTFTLSDVQARHKRTVLHFEGVDYTAKVWVNGAYAGTHSGGYARFSLDISQLVKTGENLLVVKAEDSFDLSQPRGKQRWKNYNYGCWYEQTTGIWKTVWLEFTDRIARIDAVKITPKIDEYAFEFEFEGRFPHGCTLETTIRLDKKLVKCESAVMDHDVYKTTISVDSHVPDNQVCFWSPECPTVYDMTFRLIRDGAEADCVGSYCGLREFKAVGASTQLSRYPYYQKLLLYQGYWEQTLLTAPDEAAIIKDIALIKEMGYNGIRIHQKIEDERMLYYADILGLLVWVEMPSPHEFCERGKVRFVAEWQEILAQNYNHTSVVVWVIYNESWGVREIAYSRPQQAFTEAVYKLTKATDAMRPVISNDGWEHTCSDLLTLHNYEQRADILSDYYADLDAVLENREARLPQRAPYAEGYSYGGQPVLFSEYGGCAFQDDTQSGWGYGEAVDSLEGFYERFGALVDAIKAFPYCAGYCYTQFTDVRQEKNGLLTIDRTHKIDSARIREINNRHINSKRL